MTAVIHGRDFWPRAVSSFVDDKVTLDASFTARLGETLLETVEHVSDTQLTAHVPSTLERGVYDLTVVDPTAKAGILRDAFTVYADSAHQDGAPPGDSDAPPGDRDAPAGDGPAVCTETCVCDNDATCTQACPEGGCTLSCEGQARCDGTCERDCSTECLGGSICNVSCTTGCNYSCGGSATCSVACHDTCSILDCYGNAQCVLSCVDPTECSLVCSGQAVVDCGGGVLACRAGCP